MHMRGTPRSMQAEARYDDVVAEVMAFLRERIDAALAAYDVVREKTLALSRKGEDLAARESIENVAPASEKVEAAFAAHRAYNSEIGRAGDDAAKVSLRHARALLTVIAGVTLALTISIGVLIIRSIMRQRYVMQVFVAAVLVYSALMLKLCRHMPVVRKCMFDGCTGLDRIRRVIVRIDHGGGSAARRDVPVVHGLERLRPAALPQIVIEETESSAHDCVAVARRVRNS